MPIYLLSPSTILVVEVIIKFKNMIDKKIEEAARCNADKYRNYPTLSDEDRDKVSIGSFMDCAKWMQEEFLKDLWHQTDEEPEGYDEWILLHYSVGNYYSLAQVKDFKSWKGFVERVPIENWLYIDDLFTKEGGEK